MRRDPDTVTASEIGDYVFCPEAWRLARTGAKPTPAIQAARTHGERHHVQLAVTETAAERSINRGRFLIVVGIVAILALIALWLATR